MTAAARRTRSGGVACASPATVDMPRWHVMTNVHNCVGGSRASAGPALEWTTRSLETGSASQWTAHMKSHAIEAPRTRAPRPPAAGGPHHPHAQPWRLCRAGCEHLAEADAILRDWSPHLAVIDMDHDDSTDLLELLGASSAMQRRGTPVLGLTRMGDLQRSSSVRLGSGRHPDRALLARGAARARHRDHEAGDGRRLPLIAVIRLGEIEVDIVHREVRAGSSVVHLSGIEQSCSTSWPVALGGPCRGRRSSTRSGHRLRGREQHRGPPRPDPAGQARG